VLRRVIDGLAKRPPDINICAEIVAFQRTASIGRI